MILLFAYSIIVNVFSWHEGERELVVLIFLAILIALHAFGLLMLSIYYFVQKDQTKGKDYILSMGLVLLIGFSTCYGSATL